MATKKTTNKKVGDSNVRQPRSDLDDEAILRRKAQAEKRGKKPKRTGFDDEDILPPRDRRKAATAPSARRAAKAKVNQSELVIQDVKVRRVAKDVPVRKKSDVSVVTERMLKEKPVKANLPARVERREVVPDLPDRPRKRISKNDRHEMTSIIADDAEQMLQLLEEGSNETAMSLIQKRLLQSLIDAVAHAENNVRTSKGSKGVYQLNSLITSIRELLIDQQAARDKGMVGQVIVEQIIRPNFLDIGMEFVQDSEVLKTKIRGMMSHETYKKVEDLQNQFTQKFAESLQSRYRTIQESIIKHLQS